MADEPERLLLVVAFEDIEHSVAKLVALDIVGRESFQKIIDMKLAEVSNTIVIDAIEMTMPKLPMYEYKLAPKLELNDDWRRETKAQRRRRLVR